MAAAVKVAGWPASTVVAVGWVVTAGAGARRSRRRSGETAPAAEVVPKVGARAVDGPRGAGAAAAAGAAVDAGGGRAAEPADVAAAAAAVAGRIAGRDGVRAGAAGGAAGTVRRCC